MDEVDSLAQLAARPLDPCCHRRAGLNDPLSDIVHRICSKSVLFKAIHQVDDGRPGRSSRKKPANFAGIAAPSSVQMCVQDISCTKSVADIDQDQISNVTIKPTIIFGKSGGRTVVFNPSRMADGQAEDVKVMVGQAGQSIECFHDDRRIGLEVCRNGNSDAKNSLTTQRQGTLELFHKRSAFLREFGCAAAAERPCQFGDAFAAKVDGDSRYLVE